MPLYLSLGSNREPEKNVPQCVELLKQHFRVTKISSFYETEPVGPAGNQNFWNAVVAVASGGASKEIQRRIRKIEELLGRRRDPADKYAPRTIDIDVLPQKGYQELAFIMVPLAEIAPQDVDEETGKTFGELAAALKGKEKIFRVGRATSGDVVSAP